MLSKNIIFSNIQYVNLRRENLVFIPVDFYIEAELLESTEWRYEMNSKKQNNEDKNNNNADYGLSLQRLICEEYGIEVNEWAAAQFEANYNKQYEKELRPAISIIFEKLNANPKRLLTYTKELTKGKQTTSPHNFLLDNGKTVSIRTTKTSDKVAPRTIGQAGFSVLNEYFADIYGSEIKDQEDVRKLVYENIHKILPVFIDNLFQSDYTVLISRKELDNLQIIKSDELSSYSFERSDFEFTRGLDTWKESTTLKYHGKSIAEIQTHKERSFKFRFIISSIPEWFRIVKETNETLGMSAEATICELFELKQPDSFKNRVLRSYVDKLMPVVKDAFKHLPPAIEHSGSAPGERGDQSKCSYDFVLEGNRTLSLKTNKGKMVCPPEVGQPGSKTCLLYFSKFFGKDIAEVTRESFKKMVYENIEKIMPIYVEHLFDSDWLLWLYETKKGFEYKAINKSDIKQFDWKYEKFSFTKETIEEWNESNTVKYNGISIGEFQVHNNRNCFKFRFNLKNLLEIILYGGDL